MLSKISAFTIVIISLFLGSGCSQTSNPTTVLSTFPDRASQVFESDPVQLFGDLETTYGCHDVDSAVIILEGTEEPAEIDATHWTAFVTLERQDVDTFFPMYRWVSDGDDNPVQMSDPEYVPRETTDDWDEECCSFPKCAAFELNTGIVELAVAFMVQDPDPEGNADWDIHSHPDAVGQSRRSDRCTGQHVYQCVR